MSSTGVTTSSGDSDDLSLDSLSIHQTGIADLPVDVFLIIKRLLPTTSFFGKNSLNLVCKQWDSRIKQDTLKQLKNRKFLEKLTFNQFLIFTNKFPELRQIVQESKYPINETAKKKTIGRLIMTAERQCLYLVDELMKKATELNAESFKPIMNGDNIAHNTKLTTGKGG